jgi:ubiquinone/menaquinone biosynthesis C-methylase UbiE
VIGSFDVTAGYDRGMRPLEWLILRRLRRRMFLGMCGAILEVGVGTGVNLPLYHVGARVVALDSSRRMLARAAQRPSRATVTLVCADVQHLPFRMNTFDTVSGALVFCSVEAPERGLAEVRRVLREAGRLVLVEHTRGRGLGAWLTDLLQPLWGICSSECRLNRETVQSVVDTGFRVMAVESYLMGIVRSVVASAAD